MVYSSLVITCFVCMVSFGAFQSVISKLLYQTTAIDKDGKVKNFNKPWFQLLLMFISMSFLLVIYLYKFLFNRVMTEDEKKEDKPKIGVLGYVRMSIPALCDLCASLLMNVALLWISVSVIVMLRSLIVIFTGTFTVLVRKRKLVRFEYIGSLIVILAVILLGFVEIMDEKRALTKVVNMSLVILGIVLMIIAQAVQGFQAIVEEALMHDITTPPVALVGLEGVWGSIFTMFLFVPITQFLPFTEGAGLHEDYLDTYAMLCNSHTLLLLVVFFTVFTAGFNLFYMLTMSMTNALTCDIVQQLRNLFVWGMAVFVHYFINGSYGEMLGYWSLLELAAFILMALGIFVFHGGLKIEWLTGPAEVPLAVPVLAPSPSPSSSPEGSEAWAKAEGYAKIEEGRKERTETKTGTETVAGGDGGVTTLITGLSGFLGGVKNFIGFISPEVKVKKEKDNNTRDGRREDDSGEREPFLPQ